MEGKQKRCDVEHLKARGYFEVPFELKPLCKRIHRLGDSLDVLGSVWDEKIFEATRRRVTLKQTSLGQKHLDGPVLYLWTQRMETRFIRMGVIWIRARP